MRKRHSFTAIASTLLLMVLMMGLTGCSTDCVTSPSEDEYSIVSSKSDVNSIASFDEAGLEDAIILFAPSNLSAARISYDADISRCAVTVDLTWRDNSGNEDGFIIKRRMADNGIWQICGFAGENITKFQDADLCQCRTYYYRVQAYRKSTISDFSNEISIYTATQDCRNELNS